MLDSTAENPPRLHEYADLDSLLGFKGNYMIFPLRKCTYLTDYMMQEYIDDYFGIRDPDLDSEYTTSELVHLSEKLLNDDSVEESAKEALRAMIKRRLTTPRRENELVVVPSGQLFVEALKGTQKLLESFKEAHRGLDVK